MFLSDSYKADDDNYYPQSAYLRMWDIARTLERQRDELLERLDAVLAFSITCCSGLDDDKFYPELDKLRNTHKTIKGTQPT